MGLGREKQVRKPKPETNRQVTERNGREEWNASGKTHDVVTPGVEESKRKNDKESCQNILTRKLVICYI